MSKPAICLEFSVIPPILFAVLANIIIPGSVIPNFVLTVIPCGEPHSTTKCYHSEVCVFSVYKSSLYIVDKVINMIQ